MQYSMDGYVFIFSLVEVAGFFYFSNVLTKRWSKLTEKTFRKRLFTTSLVIRVVWVIFSYFFYIGMTGQPFEFDAADALGYHSIGVDLANRGYSAFQSVFWGLGISDTGYGTYLGTVYMLFGNSIIVARLLKAVWGAWTAVLVYKVAVRNFSENAGRIAAIFFMLMPNFIYYCGLHLKEVEMVFLSVAFIERTDYLLRSRKFNFIGVFVPLLIASIMFTFRTPLGITALFAFITALLFSAKKLLGFGQRFIIGVWVVVALAYFAGGKISTEVEQLWQNRVGNQETSMNWRAKRAGGNKFADKASSLIFAPSIFIIPVPTMVNVETQVNQQILNGGNFDKEILAFFMTLAFFWILRYRKWRDFTLIGSFMLGYLGIIALSAFAQSERFHQPALPFILMFAAFGVTNVTEKSKKYFIWYMLGLLIIIIAWNYIKLSGRGMV